MYKIDRFKDQFGTCWYVSERGIAVYEGVDKSDCERYLAFLLMNPNVRKQNA